MAHNCIHYWADLELGHAVFSTTIRSQACLTTVSQRGLFDLCRITVSHSPWRVWGSSSHDLFIPRTNEQASRQKARTRHQDAKEPRVPGEADVQVKPKISKLKPHFPLENEEKT